MEEAAFLPASVVKLVIMPMLTLRFTFLMVLSSLHKNGDTLDEIMRSGLLYHLQMCYICKDCLAAGKRNVCIHKRYKMPPWQAIDGLATKMFGNDNANMRENMGVVVDDEARCFPGDRIEAMLSRPRENLYEPIRYVFMCFDPVAGSENADTATSDFVITAICSPRSGGVIILNLEALGYVHSIKDYEPTVRRVITRIRSTKYLEGCTIVVGAEAGNALEASHINSICASFPSVITVNSGIHVQGVRTTNSRKHEAMTLMRTMLDKDAVRFFTGFFTEEKDVQGLFAKIRKQFCAYDRTVIPTKSPNRPSTVCYSGKGRNMKEKDDICVTLQFTVLLMHNFLFDSKYAKYH